jgi:hypothetical protein
MANQFRGNCHPALHLVRLRNRPVRFVNIRMLLLRAQTHHQLSAQLSIFSCECGRTEAGSRLAPIVGTVRIHEVP